MFQTYGASVANRGGEPLAVVGSLILHIFSFLSNVTPLIILCLDYNIEIKGGVSLQGLFFHFLWDGGKIIFDL